VEYLRQLVAGVRDAWQRLALSARVNILLASAFTVVVIIALVVMGGRPQYVTLYDGLSAQDSAAVQEIISAEGVSSQLQRGGKTILVPRKHLGTLRVAIGSQGLPKSYGTSPGFELFDEQGLAPNQFLQDINKQRAVQGKLEKTLDTFDFVNRSYVQITEAEDEFFLDQQKPSKASVMLDVSRALTQDEVRAILAHVSAFGGAYLDQDNITLTTTKGREALHLPPRDGFDSIANSREDFRRNLELERQRRAEAALARMGVKSVVVVTLDIDFSSSKETEETIMKGAPIAQLTRTQTSTSKESLPEGPTGVNANLPTEPGATGGTETEETTEEEIINSENSRKLVERTIEPGDVKRASVAATVEGVYTDVLDGEGNPTGEKQYQEPTSDDITQYKSMIASAVGFGVTPETVEVFDRPWEPGRLTAASAVPLPTAGFQGLMVQYGIDLGYLVPLGFKLLLVVAGFLLIRRMFIRSFATMAPEDEEEAARTQLPTASPEELRRQEIASEVDRITVEQPEAVASLLRSWLAEGEE
jgi:flagellar M-ring protein FliF